MRISDWSSDVCSSDLPMRVLEEIHHSWLVIVVIVALHFQLGEHAHGIFVRPIRELNHILAVCPNWVALSRLNHNGADHPRRFLHTRVRVIPLRTVLLALEAVGERLPWRNTGETDPCQPALRKGQRKPGPRKGVHS